MGGTQFELKLDLSLNWPELSKTSAKEKFIQFVYQSNHLKQEGYNFELS